MTCDKCKHSVSIGVHKEGNIQLAECHRYPPSVFPIMGQNNQMQRISIFPQINEKISCGEFTVQILHS